MKNLAKLNGAKALSKKEQKSVNGGAITFKHCYFTGCPSGYSCNVDDGFCIDFHIYEL